jgi:DNA repair protein RecN (Recombination protein N)
MLSRLYVKNVALIREADIQFDGGLNVLSGETGSGKSVILDSVNFVLGCKADRSMIRYGEQEALVRAEFVVDPESDAVKKLLEYDIESDGTIVISRKLNLDGKGSIKVNGNSITVSMLKSVTAHLVDVHGQSEHFFLLSEVNQLKVLDSLLGEKAESVKLEISDNLKLKKKLLSDISALGGSDEERERKLDLLSYQINEIESADIKEGEFEELKARQLVIVNVEKIMSSLSGVKSILDDDGGCIDGLSTAIHLINGISSIGEEYSALLERLESLSADASDISELVGDMTDRVSFDEDEAQKVDERLTLIKTLKKKYGADEKEILEYLKNAKAQYAAISDSAATIERYQGEIAECDKKIFALCNKLTQMRKDVAKAFCGEVVEELKTLNIPNAKFEVEFVPYTKDDIKPTQNGADSIEFEFSANKGEPLKPLNKVISGGEMSRFMLAIKTRLKDINGISTYIFDEIDAGISGYTAAKVAQKFKAIAKYTQIIAVSHLPQVCAASDAQFLIYKEEVGGKTLTNINKLSKEQKIDEIVRLTGSVKTEAAKEHAKELMAEFNN